MIYRLRIGVVPMLWGGAVGLLGKIARIAFRNDRIYRVPFGAIRGMRLKFHTEMQMHMMLGLYDNDVMRYLATVCNGILNARATVCDLGANSGVYTLWLAATFPQGRVVSFEPMPKMAARLRETLAINSLKNCTVIEAAVGAAPGKCRFEIRGVDGTASSLVGATPERGEGSHTVEVELTSLDHCFPDLATMPSFLKIDVEGALPEVLTGARNLMSKKRPIFYVELHSPKEDAALGSMMKSLNYSAIRVKDGEWVQDTSKTYPEKSGVWGHLLVVPEEHRAHVERITGRIKPE